jgi:murein DD-endopeptidase MepM/ murein hydrolase activator NlpD
MSNQLFIGPTNIMPMDMSPVSGKTLDQKIMAAQAASGESQKAELKKVAQEFEAIFIAQMLKVMRSAIEESGMTDGGFGKTIYTELFDQELALNMARHGSIGIADLLYRNLSSAENANDMEPSVPAVSGNAPNFLRGVNTVPEMSGGPVSPENSITGLQKPVQSPISSSFGYRRDPFTQQVRFHKGIDFAAPPGMEVVSALPGTIISAGYEGNYGNTVLMEHADGIKTRYAHLATLNVKPGDVIDARYTLGTVGDTGRSTGTHLHFEVLMMGRPVDPVLSFNSSEMARFPSGGASQHPL